jgi:FkbM family methyltransferase
MLLGKIVRAVLTTMGWNERMAYVSMDTVAALRRIADRGVRASTVIDIGASNGMWSEAAKSIFPDANYLLIEAQQTHERELQAFVGRHPRSHYVLKAAGERSGTVFFDAADPFSGQASTEKTSESLVELPVCAVDEEVARLNLSAPYLLKFDVHGFERAILRGAEQTLANASLIVMECYNFEIAPESMLFYDMCRWFHDRGFRVIDISEPLWRRSDKAFWQIDIFFVRAERPEIQLKSYS